MKKQCTIHQNSDLFRRLLRPPKIPIEWNGSEIIFFRTSDTENAPVSSDIKFTVTELRVNPTLE